MNTTLIKLSLAAIVAVPLAGCDFGGGDDSKLAESERPVLLIESAQDVSFGTGGYIQPSLTAFLSPGETVAKLQVAGLTTDVAQRLVAVGQADTSRGRHLTYIARFSAAGQPDASCGVGGVSLLSDAGGVSSSGPLEVRTAAAANRYVVRGSARETNFTAVSQDDCSIASEVGSAGIIYAEGLADQRARTALSSFDVAADGAIVAANSEVVVRFTSSGLVDHAFGVAGVAAINFGGYGTRIESVRLRDDGRVVLAGQQIKDSGFSSPAVGVVAQLDDTGRLDGMFGASGLSQAPESTVGKMSPNTDLVLLSDGSVVAAWSSQQDGTERTHLYKVDSRGVPAAGFGRGGTVTTTYKAEHTSVTQVATDGRSLVACGALNPNVLVAQHRIAAATVNVDGITGAFTGWGAFENPNRDKYHGWNGELTDDPISVEESLTGRYHQCYSIALVSGATFVALGLDGAELGVIARVAR